MGRAPCCDKANVKRGPWSPEEDKKLKEYIEKFGTGGNWIALPHKAGLKRCGKSCRLRWLNYLRPNIKHGDFSDDEDRIICSLFASIGSRWSIIAGQLPGRTDNDIKNYWNTKLKKKLLKVRFSSTSSSSSSSTSSHTTPSSSSSMYQCSSSSSNPTYNFYNYNSSGCYYEQHPISAISCLSDNTTTVSWTPSHYMQSQYLVEDTTTTSSSGGDGGGVSINDQDMGLPSLFLCNITGEDGWRNGDEGLNMNWSWGEEVPLMDYGLEEIKQLISTTTTTNTCNNILSFNQE